MKIVVIAPSSVNHTIKIVNELANRNHQVYLFSLKNHQEGKDKICESVEVYYSPNKSPIGYILDFLWIRDRIKRIIPDVINVHYASGYGTLARLCGEHPALLSVWGSDIFDFPKKNFINKEILQRNLAFFEHVVSTSNVMALETNKYVEKKNKVSVIPFGVDLNKFKPKERDNNIKRSVKIVCIKNLEPVYGIKYLIEAIKILPNYLEGTIRKVDLEIYGRGSEHKTLRKLIIKMGLTESIQLKGYVENIQVPHILGNADICCIPSLRESFGVSVIEAMAMNTPVVATRTDGFKEIIEHNENGLVVDIASADSIARGIAFLIINENIRKDFVLKARRKVEALYDWNKNMNDFEALLNKVKNCN